MHCMDGLEVEGSRGENRGGRHRRSNEICAMSAASTVAARWRGRSESGGRNGQSTVSAVDAFSNSGGALGGAAAWSARGRRMGIGLLPANFYSYTKPIYTSQVIEEISMHKRCPARMRAPAVAGVQDPQFRWNTNTENAAQLEGRNVSLPHSSPSSTNTLSPHSICHSPSAFAPPFLVPNSFHPRGQPRIKLW